MWSKFINNHPLPFAAIIALLAGLEGLLLGGMFWRPDFLSFLSEGQALAFTLVTTLPVALAVGVLTHFLLCANDPARHIELFSSRIQKARILLASRVIILDISIMAGISATLFAFRDKGPWGDVMKGISGPELSLDAVWWPVIFLVAAGPLALFALNASRPFIDETLRSAERGDSK